MPIDFSILDRIPCKSQEEIDLLIKNKGDCKDCKSWGYYKEWDMVTCGLGTPKEKCASFSQR